jgi:hypothetical protein
MRQLRAELWTKWRGDWCQRGQTVKAFCHDRGLRDSLFYDGKKRIREGEAAKLVEVKVMGPKARPVAGHSPAIEIRLNKGRSLLVEAGFDSGWQQRRLTTVN